MPQQEGMPQQEEGRMLRIRGNSRGKVPSNRCLKMEDDSRMAMETGKVEMEMGRMGEHKPR
jgi:hypothetical protein